MYLIIDSETIGLPNFEGLKFGKFPDYTNIDKYDNARIVQLTFMKTDNNLNEIKINDYIIYSNNEFMVTNTEFHGITDEISKSKGTDSNIVYDIFYKELCECKHIIAHNIDFDINVIKSELYRKKLFHIIIELDKKNLICSMKYFKFIVQAKNKNGKIKNPSLKELYNFAFNEELENAHNSKYDVINLHKAVKKITNGIII
tara:strand:+ start:246 stop:848 length:603 start_codon:yes stop_codon:yes gene_type:complete